MVSKNLFHHINPSKGKLKFKKIEPLKINDLYKYLNVSINIQGGISNATLFSRS